VTLLAVCLRAENRHSWWILPFNYFLSSNRRYFQRKGWSVELVKHHRLAVESWTFIWAFLICFTNESKTYILAKVETERLALLFWEVRHQAFGFVIAQVLVPWWHVNQQRVWLSQIINWLVSWIVMQSFGTELRYCGLRPWFKQRRVVVVRNHWVQNRLLPVLFKDKRACVLQLSWS